MTEVHPDFGELYKFSDHKRGDIIRFRAEGVTTEGEILWVSPGGPLPSLGKDGPPFYWVSVQGDFPQAVYFGDVTMDAEEPALEKCRYCLGYHPAGMIERCPRKPHHNK